MLYVIQSAIPQPKYTLQLIYSDGVAKLVDFKPIIAEGGVFAPLSDKQVFAKVAIGSRGRFIERPGNIDFCAEALRLDGKYLAPDAANITKNADLTPDRAAF